MARPRTFDPNDVLTIALGIFWRKGYRGATLDEITEKSGLGKPSLYAAFGDKRDLFLKVLDRYHANMLKRMEHTITKSSTAREGIREWLRSFASYRASPRGNRGCLSINTSADSGTEKEILDSIRRYNAQLKLLLRNRLKKDKDQFSSGFQPGAAAFFILTFYNGMMLSGRDLPNLKSINFSIDRVIAGLD